MRRTSKIRRCHPQRRSSSSTQEKSQTRGTQNQKRKTKEADTIAAFLEATELAGFSRDEALRYFGRPQALPRAVTVLLQPLDTQAAQERFLARFAALTASGGSG